MCEVHKTAYELSKKEREHGYELISKNKVLNQKVQIQSSQTGYLTEGRFIIKGNGYHCAVGRIGSFQVPLRIIDKIEVLTPKQREIEEIYARIYVNQNHPSMDTTKLERCVKEFE